MATTSSAATRQRTQSGWQSCCSRRRSRRLAQSTSRQLGRGSQSSRSLRTRQTAPWSALAMTSCRRRWSSGWR
eukprot:2784771-Prorocentrum_lima.AAC.1